jgi:dienelactone hydrolase
MPFATFRPVSPRRLAVLAAVVLIGTVALQPETSRADVVYFKDGYAVHGKVRRENTIITDPATGLPIQINKSNSFIVDDRVRWVIFSHRIVDEGDPDTNVRGDFLEFRVPLTQNRPQQLPKQARLERYTPFNANWQRDAFLVNDLGRYRIMQRLTSLTPFAARVESTQYRWNVHYLTDELGRDAVKELLANHPDLKETAGPEIEKRMKRFRFMLQAGWLLDAEEELNKALADVPAEKDRIGRSRTVLRQSQLRVLWDEVQRGHRAGRYGFARDVLRRLPVAEVDAKLLVEVNALKAKYDAWDKQIGEARRLVDAIGLRAVGPPRPMYRLAVPAIRAGLSPDTIDRLDAFLTIAGQAERDLAAGKAPTTPDDDLLALAVTGWVMGKQSAEASTETADRLWASRDFVLTYLRTAEPSGRRRLLEDYEQSRPLGIDEMTQLIGLLPPPEPAAPTPTPQGGVEQRETQVPWSQVTPVKYLIQLPPEYQPNRAYPLLIVLHNNNEQPAAALARWADAAARNGYIAAAPLWTTGQPYGYTADEHAAVTELVRDLRRHYRIDSDRVFLTGYGQGGTMAFDVGLSHPDLFAGVVPFNGQPRWGASMWYWRNAQYLPFYLVCGELAGASVNQNRRIFENWVQRGYPSLMTIYQGRPTEFYQAEVPQIFEWMARKKRATGFPELGRNPLQGSNGEEFQTMRTTDNRFYWVSVESLAERYVNPLLDKDGSVSAVVQANIRDGNHIVVNTRGVKSMRLWLGRVWDEKTGSRTMIELDKPVRVQVNRSMYGNREHKVTPSLETMLEDLYERGDRHRLFVATIDLKNVQ